MVIIELPNQTLLRFQKQKCVMKYFSLFLSIFLHWRTQSALITSLHLRHWLH